MRASLILSALCAMSFVGGAALAEPHRAQQPREPASIEKVLHSHGEAVDKFKGAPSAKLDRADQRVSPVSTEKSPLGSQLDARRNCSDADECAGSHAVTGEHGKGSARSTPWAAAAQKTEKDWRNKYTHADTKMNCFGDECRSNRGKVAHDDKTSDPTKKNLQGSEKTKYQVQNQSTDSSKSDKQKSQAEMTPSERAQAKKVIAYIESKICSRNIDLCGHAGGKGGGSESR